MSEKWKIVFYTVVGAILGGIATYISNSFTNEKLKRELLAELQALIDKQNTARLTESDQNRITQLQAQIELLNRK